MSLQELEQDPFDADDFVERIAWRTTTNISKGTGTIEDFDADVLHSAFERTISDLKELNLKIQKRAEKLEALCHEEEKAHWQRIADLQKSIQTAHSHFQVLDERINYVATKVVHLGDQLEGVNVPRARAVEAQKLMNFFSEFLSDEPLKSRVFNDPSQLYLAADVIQKLHLIAQELPQGSQFDSARQKISDKYDQIERDLIEDFIRAHHAGEKRTMKRIAVTLSHFKGYHQCIDAFVVESQKGEFMGINVFDEALPLCYKTNQLINEVFTNPEAVMAKFVLNIYHGKLQEHINEKLSDQSDLEKYLKNLYNLYTRTNKFSNELSKYRMGNDSTFLPKLTKNIFNKYLDSYISAETRFLKEKSTYILSRYYASKHHQKKVIASGGIHDLRRDIQAKIGTKANINIGPAIEDYGGETFLSQEVAINLLQECKMAFKRCQVLSSQTELPTHALMIYDILVQYLCHEHIDYALELGLQGIPLPDQKNEPKIYFFDVVGQANTMFHLFEKQFSNCLIPLVSSSPKHSECLQKKRELMEHMENKMDTGLDRSLQAMVGWVKYVLSSEQRKTDFKPESEDVPMQMFSPPCREVVRYMSGQLESIRDALDGKNVEAVLTEFGTRFHRVIYEHLQQYQFNSMGAMLAICDVNEYRKCVDEFKIPLVKQLFNTLHALCNLLVVVPDNLKQVCTGDQLAGLDKAVLQSFVQLRADYKTAKLANHFK